MAAAQDLMSSPGKILEEEPLGAAWHEPAAACMRH